MKKLLSLALLLLATVLLTLAGCSGDDGNGTNDAIYTPLPDATPPPSTTPGTTPDPVAPGVGGAANISVSSDLLPGLLLSQGGSVPVRATVTSGGNAVADGTMVSFTASAGQITTVAPTIGGVATATFQAGSSAGPVIINAIAGSATGTITIQVATGPPASIIVDSVQPATIGVFGSGMQDAALITFLVRDAAGNPVPDGTAVTFAISVGLNGGESLTAASGTTAGGRASVSLQSGTVAGTVSIRGTIGSAGVATVAQVAIVSNRPDAGRITMGATTLNLAGGVTLGLQTTVSAYLGDRSGNVVPDGTQVSFISECGTIGTSQGFQATTTLGVASAVLQTSSPTVPDLTGLPWTPAGNPGMCRVVAFTPGKGTFLDLNGNGVFDGNDVCTTTLDEPYIDANDNGQHDAGEYYVDVNGDGTHSKNVVNCQNNAMIWTSMNLLMSDHVGSINLLPATFTIPVGGSATFTYRVADEWGNALVAGTKVKVTTTEGTLVGTTEFTQPDTVGRGYDFSFGLVPDSGGTPKPATVTVTIEPPAGANNNGAAIFAVATGMVNLPIDDPSLTPGPAPSSGDPAAILFEPGQQHLYVAGVGMSEMSTLRLTVVDSAGIPINEGSYPATVTNNLRVSFNTAPGGGEYLSGMNAQGVAVDSRADGFILVRSENGVAPINLQSGTLPGVVEIKAEVLVDAAGAALSPTIKASSPQFAIASGPPHTINLTHARASAENLTGGVYRRRATAMVTDRYGNTVPDGTVIYLGLLDSVVAEGNSTGITNSTITAAAGTFDATITRNETARRIQANDRVILRNVPAQDKSRHIMSRTGSTLNVQTPYSAVYGAKPFVVGASLLGGSIGGTLTTGTSVTGRTQTIGGLAEVYVTYPANINTINVGCGDIPNRDFRYSPLRSAQVFVIAESSSDAGDPSLPTESRYNDRATTVDEATFCFAPMAGFTLDILPTVKLSGTETRTLTLEDGGDKVPLPFWPINSFVAIDTRGKNNVCRDTALNTKAACEGGGKTWITDRQVCYDPVVTEQAGCIVPQVWSEVTSDFGVDVYINPFGEAGGTFDLDQDGFPDIYYRNAQDTNADGIPDDLNGDGTMDVFDGNVVGWKFSTAYNRYLPQAPGDVGTEFYTYPYTGIGASAAALIVVRGEFIQSGDKATVTFVAGDGEVSVPVEIP